MIVRKTALEEARRVNELFAICFEMPYTNCPAAPEKDDAPHWAAFDEDGEMMSTFTVSDIALYQSNMMFSVKLVHVAVGIEIAVFGGHFCNCRTFHKLVMYLSVLL